jgi:ABC transporter ATM
MGTHQQLVDQGGLYSQLWSAQETLFMGNEEGDPVKDEKNLKDLERSVDEK